MASAAAARRRVAVERAGEERGPSGRGAEEIHQLRLPADRGDRASRSPSPCPSWSGRGVTPQIDWYPPRPWRKPVITSSKISTVPCAVASSRTRSRKPGSGRTRAEVVRDRLEDDRGDIVLGRAPRSTSARVVEAADDRRLDDLRKHPLRERIAFADVLGQRDHVHRNRVVPAVVVALELDDVAASGGGAGDAQRMEGRLTACLGEEDLLDRGKEGADPLGELDLDRS